ncbi:MAG: hypothetical protein JWO39_1157 [Gemmatimonadetes bacterium]|nr:hypothetical protein [Gemmatimonadota bacterium]
MCARRCRAANRWGRLCSRNENMTTSPHCQEEATRSSQHADMQSRSYQWRTSRTVRGAIGARLTHCASKALHEAPAPGPPDCPSGRRESRSEGAGRKVRHLPSLPRIRLSRQQLHVHHCVARARTRTPDRQDCPSSPGCRYSNGRRSIDCHRRLEGGSRSSSRSSGAQWRSSRRCHSLPREWVSISRRTCPVRDARGRPHAHHRSRW